MAEALKPQFYVLRPNKVAIPLIAMDELPHSIRVKGVPRVLTMEDVMDMKGVGKAECRHQKYHVIDVNKTSGMPPAAVQAHLLSYRPPTPCPSASDSDTNIPASRPVSHSIFPSPKKFYGVHEQNPVSDDDNTNILNHNVEATPTPGASSKVSEVFGKHDPLPPWKDVSKLGIRLPPTGKKVYCSHWMSTGECDYAQQGCLYKHEMPLDIEWLNHLGFQDIPKWYRERFGLGKLTAIPGSGAHIRGSSRSGLMQSKWRSGPGPAIPEKTSRGLHSAPVSRASAHQARAHPQQRAVGDAMTGPDGAVQPREILESDLLATFPPSPLIKPIKGLLKSKYAPIALSPAMSANPTRSTSDADISNSRTLVQTDSPSIALQEIESTVDVRDRKSLEAATSPRSQWKFFAAHSAHNDSASEHMISRYRPSSVISDYEAELERENLKRDTAESAEYAEVVARHKNQEEQAGLA